MRDFLHAIFFQKTQNTYLQFLRYGFVAIASLMVDFGGMVFLKEIVNLNYIVAATISFMAG